MEKDFKNKKLYDSINIRIEELSKLGIDTKKYEDLLVSIDNDLSKSLEMVKEKLDNYEYYYKLDELVTNIEKNIFNNEVGILINKCKECLIIIDKDDILDNKDIKNIINRLYNCVYIVIKREIEEYGKSCLLEYVSNNTNSIVILDDIIRNEIKEKNLDKVERIKNKCMEISNKAFADIYVDIDLISLIVYEEKKSVLSSDYVKNINDLYNDFNRNSQEIKKCTDGHFKYGNVMFTNKVLLENTKVENLLKELKLKKSYVYKRLVSILLSVATVCGLGVGVIPKMFRSTYYKTTRTVYNKDGVIGEAISEFEPKIDGKFEVEIKDCMPFKESDDGYERKVTSYSFSGKGSVDLDSYFDMDLSDYGDSITTKVENKKSLSMNDFYSNTVREVVINEQDKNITKNNEDIFSNMFMIISEFFLGVSVIIIEIFTNILDVDPYYLGIINNIKVLVMRIRDKKKTNSLYKEEMNELRKLIDKIVPLIRDNTELKFKINNYYKEMVYKFGTSYEMEQFYTKINSINYNDTNKYIKNSYRLIKRKK